MPGRPLGPDARHAAERVGVVDLAADASLAGLPNARGLAVVEEDSGGAIVVLTGARLRERLENRWLGSRGQSLRDAAARVVWQRVGSAFAADLLFLNEARHRAPDLYRAVTDRWQGWFVEIDTTSDAPRWEKIASRALARDPREGRAILGPFADKHAAARAIEALNDLFDLCRYPEELAKAPRGRPCAYKEMGRCPAACDGSEPISRYRQRVREAIALVANGAGSQHAAITAQMRQAADALDFETAERLRRWLEGAEPLAGRSMIWARSLARWRVIAISRAVRARWAHLWRIDQRGARWVASVHARSDRDDLRAAIEPAMAADGATATFDDASADMLGLVCTWLYDARAETRGGVSFVAVDDEAPVEAVSAAVRRILRIDEPADGSDREIELV